MEHGVVITIPCLNYGRWLPDAIGSARDQTVPCRIIVADAGSSDDSVIIARDMGASVVFSPRKTLGAIRNAGVREALRGPCSWVVSLDADDWLASNFVEQCLANVADDVGIVAPGLRWEGRDSVPGIEVPELQMPDAPLTVCRLLQRNLLFSESMFRATAWESVGGYWEAPEIIVEDWDLWIRIMAQGWRTIPIMKPLIHHRLHPVAISSGARAADWGRMTRVMRARHADLVTLYE